MDTAASKHPGTNNRRGGNECNDDDAKHDSCLAFRDDLRRRRRHIFERRRSLARTLWPFGWILVFDGEGAPG